MGAAMRNELVGMVRPAVALEIAGRRNQEPPQRHDRLAHDALAADVARLNADVVALLDRIVDAVIVVQLDDQVLDAAVESGRHHAELMGKEGSDAARRARCR